MLHTAISRKNSSPIVHEDPVHKADVLIEALDWILRFRNRLVVIKLGGSALEDPETVRHLLTDVIFMSTVGLKLVLIHGGGKAINAAMKKSQLEPRFVQGRRFTDAATLDIVARGLDAEKLVFLSDVPGIYLDRTRPETLVSQLTERRCRELIADGTIDSGMVPKVDAALDALKAGVKKVHIVDGRMPHSLLVEIFSDKGVGTEIVP